MNLGLLGARNSHLLQEGPELTAWSLIFAAFVARFAAADYQPNTVKEVTCMNILSSDHQFQ